MSNPDPSDDTRSTTAMLELADSANRSARSQPANQPVTIFEFTERLAFLLTVGYITKAQAAALHDWFDSQGAMKLPELPGPDGIQGPRMYEMLATRIHFGPKGATTGPENIFEDLGRAIASIADSVISSTIDVLNAGTALLQAGTDLLHEVHEILQAS